MFRRSSDYCDVGLYSLADMELAIDGAKFQVQATVSETLPDLALLGTVWDGW